MAKLILYGSQAWGDAEAYSDIDVLVVLQDKCDRWEGIQRTSHLVADLSLNYNAVVSRLFMSLERYRGEQNELLRNICREGIEV